MANLDHNPNDPLSLLPGILNGMDAKMSALAEDMQSMKVSLAHIEARDYSARIAAAEADYKERLAKIEKDHGAEIASLKARIAAVEAEQHKQAIAHEKLSTKTAPLFAVLALIGSIVAGWVGTVLRGG